MSDTPTATKLPMILASEFCADFVEDIPRDVRISAWSAIMRMNMAPERFPDADWDAIDRKHDAMHSIGAAWFN